MSDGDPGKKTKPNGKRTVFSTNSRARSLDDELTANVLVVLVKGVVICFGSTVRGTEMRFDHSQLLFRERLQQLVDVRASGLRRIPAKTAKAKQKSLLVIVAPTIRLLRFGWHQQRQKSMEVDNEAPVVCCLCWWKVHKLLHPPKK